ncbi:unnamed protein product [Pieris macdunnoughi]|uniref:B-cell lymphoma 3-encoded protein n=1 Tax=Pieris macdunnoughi TaxID=345717 RepID=A0A821UCS6_9NEOP|nr:unnamed protein product [Pieris macdunnoughi]
MSQEIKSKMKPIRIMKSKLNRIPNNMTLKFLLTKDTEREDTLFKAKESDPIYQKFPNLIIINKLNMVSNTNRTTAKFTEGTTTVELSSDSISELLGQQNYDLILNAISSVFNVAAKVEAIMALLKKKPMNKVDKCDGNKTIDRLSQTDESCIVKVKQLPRRRLQRCKAYAVLDSLIPPETFEKPPPKSKPLETVQNISLIDTKDFLNEDSNMSDISFDNISLKSWQVPNSVLNVKPYFDCIEKCTSSSFVLKLVDGSSVTLKTKPPDLFHIATPENLKDLTREEQKRLLLHQAYLHWKYCMEVDEDDNLPLHIAVLENEPDLLYRHCILLKTRQESVDILGEKDLSALQLSVHTNSPQCMNILLSFGAKITQIDAECQSLMHIAAETSVECVQTILQHCREHPRKILSEKEGLWTPELEFQSDEEISMYLINDFCTMFDDQGMTPLMIASGKGFDSIVDELLKAAPQTVNIKSPSSGNTALYIATSAAYSHAELFGNTSKLSSNYLNTIATLCKYGAEPNIPNDSGNSVTMLLSEFKSNEIAQILANKVCHGTQKFDSFMLVKDDGDIKIEPVKMTKQRETNERKKQKDTAITCEDMLNDSEIESNIEITETLIVDKPVPSTSFVTEQIQTVQKSQPVMINLNDSLSLNITKVCNPRTYKIVRPKMKTDLSVIKCETIKKYTKKSKATQNLIETPQVCQQTLNTKLIVEVESLNTRKRKHSMENTKLND